MNIIKRDGREVEFNKEKIVSAILRAMKYGSGIVKKDIAYQIANQIELNIKNNITKPTVRAIETDVYYKLISHNQKDTAKAYESYRAIQEFKRNTNTTDKSIFELLDMTNEEVMKENSNKNATVAATQRDLIAGEISKDYAMRKLLPPHIVQAHMEGAIHLHDMDYMIQKIFNCMLVNLEDMLDNGTVINEKMVESPKSFDTACTVTTQIIAQISSNEYGGQSITIRHLAPYLRKTYDKEYKYFMDTYNNEEFAKKEAENRMMKSLKDGIQTIRYQLSTLQTTNGQAPFSTIYLEIVEGDKYEKEMALICEEMIKQRLEGMKNYKGQEVGESFPKLIYVLDKHNCLEGGKYDYITKLCAKCNVKRLVPKVIGL